MYRHVVKVRLVGACGCEALAWKASILLLCDCQIIVRHSPPPVVTVSHGFVHRAKLRRTAFNTPFVAG